MIFGKSKLELKVGIFVFFGLVILVTFVLLIGNIETWTSGYNLKFQFNFINGVKVGAPIRFAGLDVGEVKDIQIVFNPQENSTDVVVFGWLKNIARIPVDSTVWVNTLGLLGEKYIEIMPGKNYAELVKPNDMMTGVDPIAMHEVAQLAKNIAGGIEETFRKIKAKEGTIGKLLYDDAIYKELEKAITNKEGTVGRFLYDDSIYKEVQSLIADLRRNPWKLFWKTKEKPPKK
jgi:phospholipid/cholesterol/gamma-HCH transport system substrate-binding protein